MPGLLLESFLFTERGVGVYKRLECSQSLFEKTKHSVCFITSVPCLAIVYELFFPVENCKFHLFITYLAYENKNKHVLLAIEQ